MSLKNSAKKLGLAVFVFFNVLIPARADFERAQAAYLRGMQKEKKLDYQAAEAEYRSSLAADPRYYWAYKRIAACRYSLGDKAGALQDYDRYVAANPIDLEARQYAASLRASLAR